MNAAELVEINARIARTFFRNVPSPCVSICRMDVQSGLCEGCFRTLDEIRGWGVLPDERRRDIWKLVEARVAPVLAAQAAAKAADASADESAPVLGTPPAAESP